MLESTISYETDRNVDPNMRVIASSIPLRAGGGGGGGGACGGIHQAVWLVQYHAARQRVGPAWGAAAVPDAHPQGEAVAPLLTPS
eukprot:533257-Prorocentrum_minimum.AAC.1